MKTEFVKFLFLFQIYLGPYQHYPLLLLGCVRLDVYGSNCDKPCSRLNCPDPICNVSNGACFRCTPGWTGEFCHKSKEKNKPNKHTSIEICVI